MDTNQYRGFDGVGNNLANQDWGAANTSLLRQTSLAYADGFAELAERGDWNPNPRQISNQICRQVKPVPNRYGLSNFMWAWGQFLDHECNFIEHNEDEQIPIQTPDDDPVLPNATIPFLRSNFAPDGGSGPGKPRQQINSISSYLDATSVYGANVLRASALRTFDGTGRLKVTPSSVGDLLPYNLAGLPNMELPTTPPESLFLAGDTRSNENVILTASPYAFCP